MSFRRRLGVFFLVIVVVPMITVALVLFGLIADNETGKADAGLSAGVRAAAGLYREAGTSRRARSLVTRVASDGRLAGALQAGDYAGAGRRAQKLLRLDGVVRVRISNAGGALVDAGERDAVAPSIRRLVTARGQRPLGDLEVSVERTGSYLRQVSKITGLQALPAGPGLPAVGNTTSVRRGGVDYRGVTFAAQGFGRERLYFTLLQPRTGADASVSHGRLLAGAILAGFFSLALAFALLLSRALQQQIAEFLSAARRLGSGDFSQAVPVQGRDEFAALGAEFNRMSTQLEERLEELGRQRARLEESMQRIGETFASKLDRGALVEIALRTAVDALEARGGRASVREDAALPLRECASVGPAADLAELLGRAEDDALGAPGGAVAADGKSFAIAQTLHGSDEGTPAVGVISIARDDRPFDTAERELFDYLARQATVSVENVGLHEIVQKQAVTDELTGLFNRRRFQEALESESERARRFELSVGVVMLDLDDFKAVNDTHGHQQGDQVLREVARLMRSVSREIDSPARYGGEEMALVLPQTDLDGAFQLAERLREGIAELTIPLVDGSGQMSITASLGVAASPVNSDQAYGLIAAADAALYEAKRSGKNKTVRAR